MLVSFRDDEERIALDCEVGAQARAFEVALLEHHVDGANLHAESNLNRVDTTVIAGRTRLELAPFTAGFYVQRETRLAATRRSGERHQFITIELSAAFLERHVALNRKAWHSGLEQLLHKRSSGAASVSEPIRLTSEQQQLTLNLRNPPVAAAARDIWYHAKVLEVAAAMLYRSQPGDELFCKRQKRLNHERVRRVIALLRKNVAEPPALEEIGRRVGCSHFYLSRTFTTEMGCTISQYLRELRMERAAALLREGRLNVYDRVAARMPRDRHRRASLCWMQGRFSH